MIPFYLNLGDLDLLDSRWGIVIAFAVNAFNIILMRNFFESVSPSFEEAARMDGANDFQILWQVYIPLAKPAIATVAMLCAIARWNGYFWAMVMLRDEKQDPAAGLPPEDDRRHQPDRGSSRGDGHPGLLARNHHRRDHRPVDDSRGDRVSHDPEVLHQGRDDGWRQGMAQPTGPTANQKAQSEHSMNKICITAIAAAISLFVTAAPLRHRLSSRFGQALDLSIHMHFRDKYVWNEDWPVAKELTRLTNIKLVNTASKVATNSREQYNLLMASGKLPDIIGGDGLKDEFIRRGMEGALQPLNKLIDQHAPNFKA